MASADGFSPHIDKNLFPANLHWIAIHPRLRILPAPPRPDAVFQTMPWASPHRALQPTIPQRPATVDTRIVDGVKLSVHIGHRHRLAAPLKLSYRSRRHIYLFSR